MGRGAGLWNWEVAQGPMGPEGGASQNAPQGSPLPSLHCTHSVLGGAPQGLLSLQGRPFPTRGHGGPNSPGGGL